MEKIVSDCVIKPKMNCFNCEVERTCKSCLDLVSREKTYSSDNNMLKKPENYYHQMPPYFIGEYEPKQIFIDFESGRKILMEEEYKMVAKRRFESKYNMTECKSYMKYEKILENTEFFLWFQTY